MSVGGRGTGLRGTSILSEVREAAETKHARPIVPGGNMTSPIIDIEAAGWISLLDDIDHPLSAFQCSDLRQWIVRSRGHLAAFESALARRMAVYDRAPTAPNLSPAYHHLMLTAVRAIAVARSQHGEAVVPITVLWQEVEATARRQ